jgi:ligand-binding sensor domain-containing protein
MIFLVACEEQDIMPDWEKPIAEGITIYDHGDIMSITKFEGNIYASGRDGVYMVDSFGESHVLFEEYNMSYVRSIYGSDRLYIATDIGLYIYDGVDMLFYNSENSTLPDNRINVIFEDRVGDIWIGTWGGVTNLSKNITYTSEDGLWVDNVSVIAQSFEETLWFGSYAVRNGGVTLSKDASYNYFTLENGLTHENITAILCDNDTVYVGSGLLNRGGLDILKLFENNWVLYDTILYEGGLLAGEKVRSLSLDDNMLWIGSEYDGLAILNLEKNKSVILKLSLPHPEIKVIYPDGDDIWLGTLDGLGKLSQNEVAKIYSQLK